MITGLTRPDAGRATVAGKPFAELPNPARTVGTLLDAAAFHDGRTGRETLHIACTMTGVPKAAGRPTSSTPSACPATPTAGSAATRSACGSGSASPTPSSASQAC